MAETIDRDVLADAVFRGISAAHPRIARRAFAKGDKARAREFAQQVVDAWGVADVKLPVVDEMRTILDKTK